MRSDKRIGVSIIVPVFNTDPFFLSNCLSSLSRQRYNNFEVLLIDSSTDKNTITILDEFRKSDSRFRVISSTKGVSKQRNVGIENAKFPLLAFVDSDDFISPNYLADIVEIFERKEVDIVFPQLKRIEYSNHLPTKEDFIEIAPLQEKIDDSNFFVNTPKNGLVNPVKVYSKEIIGKTRFDEKLSHGEDMMFNYELSKKGFLAHFCPSALYSFTAVQGNNAALKRLSRSSIVIIKRVYDLLKIYKNKSSKNFEGIYYQFSYLFRIYYYTSIKYNQIKWVLWLTKYRFYYLRNNHSPKWVFYLLFPFLRKAIFKLIKKDDS